MKQLQNLFSFLTKETNIFHRIAKIPDDFIITEEIITNIKDSIKQARRELYLARWAKNKTEEQIKKQIEAEDHKLDRLCLKHSLGRLDEKVIFNRIIFLKNKLKELRKLSKSE